MNILDSKVFINCPFRMLRQTYLPLFLARGLNPEIGMDWQSLDRFGTEDYIHVARPLQKAGLKINIHGPFIDLAPGAIDPLVRDVTKKRFTQVLSLLPIFQPHSVVFHGGFDQRRYREIEEQWVEGALETWSQFIDPFEKQAIPIMIENVYEESPEFLARLFEAIDSPNFRFCFDTGHFNLWSRASLETWLQRLGDRIGEIHLHDNHGIADEHLAIGRGSFKFEALFEWLRHKELQPLITLEPHNEEDVEASIENLRRLCNHK